MKSTEALRKIMTAQQIGPTKMAKLINASTPRIVTDRLAQKNLSIKLFDEMLKVLGYRIIILPQEETTPEHGIDIEA